MRKKKIEFIHNGFHGRTTIRLFVPAEAQSGDIVEVSPSVARRLNRAVCSRYGCQCGEAVAVEDGHGRWIIRIPDTYVVNGRYPSR